MNSYTQAQDKPRSSTLTSSRKVKLRQELLSSLESVIKHNLKSVLVHCCDLFKEMSTHAYQADERSFYIKSESSLRLSSDQIIAQFYQGISQRALSDKPESLVDDFLASAPPTHHLSLVDDEDEEKRVLICNMAQRIDSCYAFALKEFHGLLQHLFEYGVTDNTNPFGPRHLVHNMACALYDKSGLNHRAIIIVVKEVERFWLAYLIKFFEKSTQHLLDNGLAPLYLAQKHTYNPAQVSAPQGSANANSQSNNGANRGADAHGTAQRASQQQSSFDTQHGGMSFGAQQIHDAIAALRNDSSKSVFENSEYIRFADNPGKQMTTAQIFSLLSTIQYQVYQRFSERRQVYLANKIVNSLIKSKSDGKQTPSVSHEDERIINIISEIFSQISSDSSIPSTYRLSICQLQIPALRLALREKSLLENVEHPVRKLVNCIYECALLTGAGQGPQSAKIMGEINKEVLNLNKKKEITSDDFAHSAESLMSSLNSLSSRQELTEARTLQSLQGKLKISNAKLSAANGLVNAMQNKCLSGDQIQFLTSSWVDVLSYSYLQNDAEFLPSSIDMLTLPDALTDLNKDSSNLSAQKRAQYLVKEGLKLMNASESEIDRYLETVCQHNDLSLTRDINEQDLDTLMSIIQANTPKTAIQKQQDLSQKTQADVKKMAETMEPGVRVEFKIKGSQTKVYKVLNNSQDNQLVYFVNSLGLKVCELSYAELCTKQEQGNIRILTKRPLFDRVLFNISSRLQVNSDRYSLQG